MRILRVVKNLRILKLGFFYSFVFIFAFFNLSQTSATVNVMSNQSDSVFTFQHANRSTGRLLYGLECCPPQE